MYGIFGFWFYSIYPKFLYYFIQTTFNYNLLNLKLFSRRMGGATTALLIVSIGFIVFVTPNIIFNGLEIFRGKFDPEVRFDFHAVSMNVYNCNFIINYFVYAAFNRQFNIAQRSDKVRFASTPDLDSTYRKTLNV